jgi:D-arabinose 1-dehydrogenase-like Zn-dependent alcohol dehydrogenase
MPFGFPSERAFSFAGIPIDKAPEAYARMMDGKARFRMVLVNGNGGNQ